MINVIAEIKLFNAIRKTPFTTGYRPLINFIADMKKSGKITLINKEKFSPGEQGLVQISFIDENYLGKDFGKGKNFTFGEGASILGEGKIIDIVH